MMQCLLLSDLNLLIAAMSHMPVNPDNSLSPEYGPPACLCALILIPRCPLRTHTSAAPENLLEKQIRANLRSADWETLKRIPSNLCFNKPFRWFWCVLAFANSKCFFLSFLLKFAHIFFEKLLIDWIDMRCVYEVVSDSLLCSYIGLCLYHAICKVLPYFPLICTCWVTPGRCYAQG